MRSLLLVGSAGLMCLAFGCGTDDAPSGAGTAGASAGGSGTSGGTTASGGAKATGGDKASGGVKATGGDKASGGAKATGGDKASGGSDTSTAGKEGGGDEAGADSGATLSAACQKYCECHEKNCATDTIPDGKSCGDFCMAMTEQQLTCRQNMCTLVPAQPNNNHCKHSLGINECL